MPKDEIVITTDNTRVVGVTEKQAYYLKRPGRWVVACTIDDPAPQDEAAKLNAALANLYLNPKSS